MSNPTSNFGWQMPTPTDLVTDLPADFEVFGQAVDTRLKALQPGTTLGDIAYSSATADTNTRLALGTAAQVLTVNGGATAPEWATPISGSLTLLSTTTMSGASTTISSISGAYTNLYITLQGATWGTACNNFRMNVNGSTSDGLVMTTYSAIGASTVTGHANYNDYRLTNQMAMLNSSDNNTFSITIFDYANATRPKLIQALGTYLNSSSNQAIQSSPGFYNSNTAVTSLTFEQSNGVTSTAGTIKIYGVK